MRTLNPRTTLQYPRGRAGDRGTDRPSTPVQVPMTLRDATRRRTRVIPDATVSRLPVYHRLLTALAEHGVEIVSSEELAATAGVTSASVRKDLSYLGSHGARGIGYDVTHLLGAITRALGLVVEWPVAIVGVGHLGQALASYAGFGSRGFRIVALLDADPARVGCLNGGLEVHPVSELENVVRATGAVIGVIATPASAAQSVCDRLVAAGIRSIVNFAPLTLSVPSDVEVRKVDLAVELQILAFHEQRRSVSIPECSA